RAGVARLPIIGRCGGVRRAYGRGDGDVLASSGIAQSQWSSTALRLSDSDRSSRAFAARPKIADVLSGTGFFRLPLNLVRTQFKRHPMSSFDEFLRFDVAALSEKIRSKQVSPAEITDAYLNRIEATETR